MISLLSVCYIGVVVAFFCVICEFAPLSNDLDTEPNAAPERDHRLFSAVHLS
jgi:hypothetical protein